MMMSCWPRTRSPRATRTAMQPGCGHPAVQHGDHTDFIHEGHRHAAHADHYDEH